MATKRKDHKGRLLVVGESQRKDGMYQYRFTDYYGNRQTIYASSLNDLRKKEDEISVLNMARTNFSMRRITVGKLIESYIKTKTNVVRRSTAEEYNVNLDIINSTAFSQKQIGDISCLDAKQWLISLDDAGKAYSTISEIKSIANMAFQMAVECDYIIKNPFNFKLGSIIKNKAQSRDALTDEQYHKLLDFIENDDVCIRYYDQIAILGETGLRVSEMCGLTIDDVDFANDRVHVCRQVIQDKNGNYYIEKPKTKKGERYIPLSPLARQCFEQAILGRKTFTEEVEVDDISGFIFLTNRNHPITRDTVGRCLRSIMGRYHRMYRDDPDVAALNITPHTLRHTFCTRLINRGVNIKTVQYLMGHSSANTTLNIYTHSQFDEIEQEFHNKIWAANG